MKRKHILILMLCLSVCLGGCDKKSGEKEAEDGLTEFRTSYGLSFRLPEGTANDSSANAQYTISNEASLKGLSAKEQADNCFHVYVDLYSCDAVWLGDPGITDLGGFSALVQHSLANAGEAEKQENGYAFTVSTADEYRKMLVMEGNDFYYTVMFACDIGSGKAKSNIEEYIPLVKVVELADKQVRYYQAAIEDLSTPILRDFGLLYEEDWFVVYQLYGYNDLNGYLMDINFIERSLFEDYPANAHEALKTMLEADEIDLEISDRGIYSYCEYSGSPLNMIAAFRTGKGVYMVNIYNIYSFSVDISKNREIYLDRKSTRLNSSH